MKQKKELLEHLKRNPIFQSACARVGISRSTVYRWMEDDEYFLQFVKQAQNEGNEFVADMAKSQVIKQISEGNLIASFFWLKTRKKEEFAESVIHEHKLVQDKEKFTPEMEKEVIAAHLRSMSVYFGKELDHIDVEKAIEKAWKDIDDRERSKKEYERKLKEQYERTSEK